MDKWWWLNWPPWRWSREEQNAVSQLGLTAAAVFVALSLPQLLFLRGPLWNSTLVALITTVATLFISLLSARPLCNAFCPEALRAGDEKAAERMSREDARIG
jgi:hypothetical protein